MHVRARESEGTACVVVVSGTRFESFFILFFILVCTHVRPRTYGHVRAKERPVWLFLACSLKVFYFFLHVRPHTSAFNLANNLLWMKAVC